MAVLPVIAAALPEILGAGAEVGAGATAAAGAGEVAAAGAGAAEAGAGAAEAGAGAADTGGSWFSRAQGALRDFNDSPVGKVVGSQAGHAVTSATHGTARAVGGGGGGRSPTGGVNIGPIGNM